MLLPWWLREASRAPMPRKRAWRLERQFALHAPLQADEQRSAIEVAAHGPIDIAWIEATWCAGV